MIDQQRNSRFDVVSLGETMLRLSVPIGERLDDARALDVEVGGAESNVCVALARLGRRCGWVSRLPDHALGNAVLRSLRADGLDVSAVKRVPGERVGVYFLEYATQPRSIQVIYDRANSAASRMTVDDIDWDYLLDTRVLHITGITAALSDSCYEVVEQAIRRARDAGVRVSFDVNYRAKLWDAATAGERLRPLIAQADLLFCKSADATLLFGCTGEPPVLMSGLKSLTKAHAIFCTFGEQGAALLLGDEFTSHAAIAVQIVDRIGSGDAFAAGVLDGVLAGDVREGLRRGVALAAIALSQHGDRLLTSRAELDAVLAQSGHDVVR
ncbi:MAG TPA: sugar kinase [Herpetosiphonaceae bacterium]|nr:sugar kinase [Herpetosiphonaceae bacterium]